MPDRLDPGALATPPAADGLRGCHVLVLRPAHQAQRLCALVEAAGGSTRNLPMFDIRAVGDPSAAGVRLERARAADRWIFSSRNAVDHAARLAPPPWPSCAAVGAATAAALEALGQAAVVTPPAGDGAAALLAHPAFARVDGRRISLISGEQPLPDLAEGLIARGARIETIAVYRRVALTHPPETLAQAIALADVAIVPSAEALQRLVQIVPAASKARLLDLQLALPSPRVVEKARELGFRRTPLMPRRVSDSAYVDVLRDCRGLDEASSRTHRP